MQSYISFFDVLIATFYFAVLLLFGFIRGRSSTNKLYNAYYAKGLLLKLLAAVAFCLLSAFYYGGDTLYYFRNGQAMSNMFFYDPSVFFKVLFGDTSLETLTVFNDQTGYIGGLHDSQTFAMRRFAGVFVLLGAKSFLASGLVVAAMLYGWAFRLFCFLSERYPFVRPKYFFISVLLIPSALFWSSGLLKDSLTFAGLSVATVSLFYVMKGRKWLKNSLLFVFGAYFLYAIKPYLLFALVIGIGIAFFIKIYRKIGNSFIRTIAFPIVVLGVYVGALQAISLLGGYLGGIYETPEEMLQKAQVVQQDLIREQYGDNSFDIGAFDASFASVLKKMPQAIIAGLYRPFLWEVRGVMPLISALENLALIFLTLFVLKKRFKHLFASIFTDTYMGFAIAFSIAVAFMVGLSTANFGALVRYKIPLLPFFVSFWLILYFKYLPANMDKTNSVDKSDE